MHWTKRFSPPFLGFIAVTMLQFTSAGPISAEVPSDLAPAQPAPAAQGQTLRSAPEAATPGAPGDTGSVASMPPSAVSPWRRSREQFPIEIALAQRGGNPFAADTSGEEVLDWETGAGKSYLVPALEVPGFLLMLNLFDRTALSSKRTEEGRQTYGTNFSTFWNHLRKQNWVFDNDPFNVNQFGHPYQGATMYGLARSAGLNFWESLAYSNAGSFLWETGGENSRPSINDIITTGNSGSLLGEALFRMSELVLKEGGPSPNAWYEASAAALSPSTGFNRWAFGDRFRTLFPSHDPATFWRIRLGASLSGNSEQNAVLDFQMSYGLPGKPGYTYRRPLDYFDFQIGGLSRANNPVSYVLLRGLLYGKDYQSGDNFRGIYGLYGSYDYLSPTVFRVSTTALSLGSTAQYWMAHDLALQGSLLGGVGFGAAGQTPNAIGTRDYHYGVAPHILLALRLLFDNRAALELVGRGYYVSGAGSDNSEGTEQIARITTALTFRVYRRHALGVQFVESLRAAHYGNRPGTHLSDGTVSLVYTFLGDSHFGAVEWRDLGSR